MREEAWGRSAFAAASADSLRVQLACQPKLTEELACQPKLTEELACQPKLTEEGGRPDVSEGWRPHRDSNPGLGLERAAS
jgi:hypothetical protein